LPIESHLVKSLRIAQPFGLGLVLLQFVLLLSVDMKSQDRERFPVKVVELTLMVPAQLARCASLGNESVGTGDAALRFGLLFAGFAINAALIAAPLAIIAGLRSTPNRQSAIGNRQLPHG
jgi:hypothetical protein